MLDRVSGSPITSDFSGNIWRNGHFQPGILSLTNGWIRRFRPDSQAEPDYFVPPFCDAHIHGGWGLDFHSGAFDALESHLIERGVFLAVPTLDNCSWEELERVSGLFGDYRRSRPEGIFPFLRVEGPFISSDKKGFQRAEHIQPANPENIHRFLSLDEFRMFTFAPEIPGALDLARQALLRGKIPSIGHSRAGYGEIASALNLGVRHFTHFPNAVSGLHHREIGIVGAVLLHDHLQLEIIADGIHSSPEFLRLILKLKGPSVALVSDMIPPAHSRTAEFDSREIVKSGRKLTTTDGTLAGGATSIPEQVVLLKKLRVPPEGIVRMACLNTPGFFGLPAPGLDEGKPASFLKLDRQMKVRAVVFKGRMISEGKS